MKLVRYGIRAPYWDTKTHALKMVLKAAKGLSKYTKCKDFGVTAANGWVVFSAPSKVQAEKLINLLNAAGYHTSLFDNTYPVEQRK